jgi:hypothetical protein
LTFRVRVAEQRWRVEPLCVQDLHEAPAAGGIGILSELERRFSRQLSRSFAYTHLDRRRNGRVR